MAAGLLGLIVVAIAVQTPWEALGEPSGPLDRLLPLDVDLAVRLDPGAVAASGVTRRLDAPALRTALRTLQVAEVDASLLGRDVVYARHAGNWLALNRTPRLGAVLQRGLLRTVARCHGGLRSLGDGVEQIETDDGEVLYTARWRDVEILSDEPGSVRAVLACCRGGADTLGDLPGASDALDAGRPAGTRVLVWAASGRAGELLEFVLPLFGQAGAVVGAMATPDEIDTLRVVIDLQDGSAVPSAELRWTYPDGHAPPLERWRTRPARELAARPPPLAADLTTTVHGAIAIPPRDLFEVLDLSTPDGVALRRWTDALGDVTVFTEALAAGDDGVSVRAMLVSWESSGPATEPGTSTAGFRATPVGLLHVRPAMRLAQFSIPAAATGGDSVDPVGAGDGPAVVVATVDFSALAAHRAAGLETASRRRAEELLRQEERSLRRTLTVALSREGLRGDELRSRVDVEVATMRSRSGEDAWRVAADEQRELIEWLERIGRVTLTLAPTEDGAQLVMRLAH